MKRSSTAPVTSKTSPPHKKQRQPTIAPTTEPERMKIIRKVLPLLQKQTAINYADVGRHCQPPRDGKTVKKIVERYKRGEAWADEALQWGKARNPAHEPIRVHRRVQDLRAADPKISDRGCARALSIAESTFADIAKKIRDIPSSQLVFSSGNPNFAPMYLMQLKIPTDTLRATFFSLTHMGVTGSLVALAKANVKVTVLLDRQQVLSPFELPRVRELLEADIDVFVQKSTKTTQHQNMVIADDVMCSTGSASPSMKGLHDSYESLTYHFIASEIDKATVNFLEQMENDCERVTLVWLDEQERKLTASRKASLASASEGVTEEERAALQFVYERGRH